MYDNRMTVDVTVKCIECNRAYVTEIHVRRDPEGTSVLDTSELRVPDGWQRRAERGPQPRRMLLCPVCSSEAT